MLKGACFSVIRYGVEMESVYTFNTGAERMRGWYQ